MEALLKHTEESDPGYANLKKCVDQISAIADEVNEKYVMIKFRVIFIRKFFLHQKYYLEYETQKINKKCWKFKDKLLVYQVT